MKIIKIIFLSLLALGLIACTGIFIFFQTFDADQYLPQITKKASVVLGRPVSVKHVGLGLSSRGITLDAWPLTIADDPDFTSQPFIKVARVRVSLDLGSLIFHREIHITNILLQSPRIHFICSQEGNINVRTIGQASRRSGGDDAAVIAGSNVTGNSSTQGVQNTIAVKPSVPSKERAAFSNINIRSITIQDASISFIDQNQSMPLDIWLRNINVNLNGFSFSEPLRLTFDASLYSNDPNVHGSVLVSWDPSKRSAQVSDLSLHMDLSRLDSQQLKNISPEMRDNSILKNIAGVIQLNVPHLDIGTSGEITANGNTSITGGIIKDFNIVKAVLSSTLGAFGGMGGNIDDLLNGPLKDKLGAKDTVIEKAEAQFSLHGRTFVIDDSVVKTDIFEFTAKGSVDQGLSMDMQTMLHLNEDVSAALIDEFEGLKYLCDDTKRIAIDATLKGVIPHLKYKPNKDFRKKSRKMLMEEGGNILGTLLGGGQTSSQDQDTASQDTSSQDTGKKHKIKFKDILKNFMQ